MCMVVFPNKQFFGICSGTENQKNSEPLVVYTACQFVVHNKSYEMILKY